MMTKAAKFAILFTVMIWTGGLFATAPERVDATAHRADVTTAAAPALVGSMLAAAPADSHGEAGAHGTDHAEDRSLLSPQPGAYFWQILLFLILFAVLAKFVWPPILKGLQDREKKIHDDLQQAEDARKQAEATLGQYKQELAQAQKKAQEVIDQSRAEAQNAAARVKAEAEAELNQLRDRAQQDIRSAKEQALADLYAQTATLATQVAGQILRREISPDDQEALVQESLAKLKDRN